MCIYASIHVYIYLNNLTVRSHLLVHYSPTSVTYIHKVKHEMSNIIFRDIDHPYVIKLRSILKEVVLKFYD